MPLPSLCILYPPGSDLSLIIAEDMESLGSDGDNQHPDGAAPADSTNAHQMASSPVAASTPRPEAGASSPSYSPYSSSAPSSPSSPEDPFAQEPSPPPGHPDCLGPVPDNWVTPVIPGHPEAKGVVVHGEFWKESGGSANIPTSGEDCCQNAVEFLNERVHSEFRKHEHMRRWGLDLQIEKTLDQMERAEELQKRVNELEAIAATQPGPDTSSNTDQPSVPVEAAVPVPGPSAAAVIQSPPPLAQPLAKEVADLNVKNFRLGEQLARLRWDSRGAEVKSRATIEFLEEEVAKLHRSRSTYSKALAREVPGHPLLGWSQLKGAPPPVDADHEQMVVEFGLHKDFFRGLREVIKTERKLIGQWERSRG